MKITESNLIKIIGEIRNTPLEEINEEQVEAVRNLLVRKDDQVKVEVARFGSSI